MLKGLATWFLNNYLGKYLDSVNTDQLSIALLEGQVELNNVPLRRDAFRSLDGSLDVKIGYVGHIKLKIPVVKLRSEPWSILLKEIYIVVGPGEFKDYDEEEVESLALEKKLASLDGIEAQWRAEMVHEDQEYTSWMSHGTSFIATILENLQVEIQDVHIRYEDSNMSSHPFAAGFKLQSLIAQTCDENWFPKFVYREAKEMNAYKIVELNDLSFYLNPIHDENHFYSNITDINQLREKMSSEDSSPNYLLKPVSATATLKRNCQIRPLNSRKTPRFVIDLQLPSIPLEISNDQYACGMNGIRALHQLRKNQRGWKWRPLVGIAGNARNWWQYIIAVHIARIREKRLHTNVEIATSKAKENPLYVKAFKAYLLNPLNFDPEYKEIKDHCDNERSYEELKILRELAVLQIKSENKECLEESNPEPLEASNTVRNCVYFTVVY